MSLKDQINNDLKQALLRGNKQKVTTLRGLKSVILNEEISQGLREQGLSEAAIIQCLKKESKRRQEAAELYEKAGSIDRAETERAEKQLIDSYLPAVMSDSDINDLIDSAIETHGPIEQSKMGVIIGAVKAASGGAADGAQIARLVQERLASK